jgi:hypothetical protein
MAVMSARRIVRASVARKPSEHVLYEIQMLCSLADYFETGAVDAAVARLPRAGLPARNALVESFAIHARQLIEFLTKPVNRRNTTAGDFTREPWRPPTFGPQLETLADRLSKQLAHLTRHRASMTNDDGSSSSARSHRG